MNGVGEDELDRDSDRVVHSQANQAAEVYRGGERVPGRDGVDAAIVCGPAAVSARGHPDPVPGRLAGQSAGEADKGDLPAVGGGGRVHGHERKRQNRKVPAGILDASLQSHGFAADYAVQ